MNNYRFTVILSILATILTDMSAQQIALVKDINILETRNGNPIKMAVCRDTLFFIAQNGLPGSSLWKSDGTVSGTSIIGPKKGTDYVREFFFFKNAFYFVYNDGVHGAELWISNGTAEGTHLFMDIYLGKDGADIAYPTICNDKLFFRASDVMDFNSLYVSDGTVSGTKKLKVMASVFNGMDEFIVFKNKVYFPGGNESIVRGLFTSDGTDLGTKLVKEGVFGNIGGNFAALNEKMFFSADDNMHGSELWESDGTSANTKMLFNIATNDKVGVWSNGGPHNFFRHEGTVYFAASDGINGNELWATDGTQAGTRLVADLLPGDGGVSPSNFTLYNNMVYFFGNVGGATTLYKTDGTISGTKLVKTFPGESNIYTICHFNSMLYLAIGGGIASSVWVSDGTGSGTTQINPVISSSSNYNMNFASYKGELYLPAYTTTTGMELYKLSGPSTGIEESEKGNALLLYPNPGIGSFRLSNKRKLTDLRAYDAMGNNVGLEQEGEIIHLRSTAKGIYFLQISLENNQKKTIKLEIY